MTGPGTLRRRVAGRACLVAVFVALTGCGASGQARAPTVQPSAANTAAVVDPRTPLGGAVAPKVALTEPFGQRVSLSMLRGRVVLLAFLGSRCTTICPLTSVEMLLARRALGPKAAREVALVAINANPIATSVGDVYAYSKAHGMLPAWWFLTADRKALSRVWRDYGVAVAIEHGAIDHTPAVYVISARGREERVYMTELAYAAVGQPSPAFAHALARVLPWPTAGSRAVLRRGLGSVPNALEPGQVTLPVMTPHGVARTYEVQPGRPVLIVFFATWLSEFGRVRRALRALDRYEAVARQERLPGLVAVDEAQTEPSSSALEALMRRTGKLSDPVVVDRQGTLADSLGVQDLTWYTLLGAGGRIVWQHDGVGPARLLGIVRRDWSRTRRARKEPSRRRAGRRQRHAR